MRRSLYPTLLIVAPAFTFGAEPVRESPRMLKVLVLEGTARERGRTHGKAMKDDIHRLLKLWKKNLATSFNTDADAFITRFVQKTTFLAAMKKWTPELVDEVEGIAEGAGIAFETMFVFQLLDEVWINGEAIVGERCSSLGFSRTGNRPACIAQNMDLEPFYDGFQLVLHIKHNEANLESFVLTVPGFLGLNGVNNRSVAVCCNTLLQLSNCRDGLPVACVVRGVLQQRSEEDAAAFLHKVKHASGQNYVLGGPVRAASYECSAHKVSPFTPRGRDGIVWHTNHPLASDDESPQYRAMLKEQDALQRKEKNTRTRLECLEKRLLGVSAFPGVDRIKETLASQDSKEFPICRPKGPSGMFTFASTIMVLTEEPEFHVAPGPPNVTTYEKLSFSKRSR